MRPAVSNSSATPCGGSDNRSCRALAEQARIVRLPLNKIGSINKINKAFAKLEQEHERPPTAHELAELLEMTLEEVKTSLNNTGRHVSMDAPLRDDGDSGTMMDVMQNDDTPSPLDSLMTDSLRCEIERSLELSWQVAKPM